MYTRFVLVQPNSYKIVDVAPNKIVLKSANGLEQIQCVNSMLHMEHPLNYMVTHTILRKLQQLASLKMQESIQQSRTILLSWLLILLLLNI